MAARLSVVVRTGGAAVRGLLPVSRPLSRRRPGPFNPQRSTHGVRSSLYEHVREGYSDKPELDMRAVCEETHKVIANVESRKGELRGDDVGKIVSWKYLKKEISELEQEKRSISQTVRELVVSYSSPHGPTSQSFL
uniref:Uncharacterized protein n=1 Tax=Nothobranchius furzeri TaxID=105023 RepID=A0A8C6P5Y8_NOTFU